MAKILGDKTLLCKLDLGTGVNQDTDQTEYLTSTVVANEALQGKVVCLFFSASWCTPCQHFVPLLKEVYTELQQRSSPLEIIFLSFDKTEEDMMKYYHEKHGNWLAVKFGDPIKEDLAEQYGISIIPKLIVIQPDGEIITSKGRKDVQDKGLVCMRGWQAGLTRQNTNADKGEANVDSTDEDNHATDNGQEKKS